MADAAVIFQREGREGLVAVGTFLSDALKRFGIRLEEPCEPQTGLHTCSVTVISGEKFLSPLTAREREHLSGAGRRKNVRLACEAKITGPGEIVIMTDQKKKVTPETEEKPKLVKEFETLPLEQKIANLVRMEAVTLGETLSFVVNSPFTVFEKIGDVMAEFGMKLEREAKKAARPAENGTEKPQDPPKKEPAAKKTGTRARPRKAPPKA